MFYQLAFYRNILLLVIWFSFFTGCPSQLPSTKPIITSSQIDSANEGQSILDNAEIQAVFRSGCTSPKEEEFPAAIYVGMSLSLTGRYMHHQVVGLVFAMVEWVYFSRGFYWDGSSVYLCAIDDQSNETRAREIYEAFVDPQSAQFRRTYNVSVTMDVLLGPSAAEFGYSVGRVTSSFKRLLMLWADDYDHYYVPYTLGSSTCIDGRCKSEYNPYTQQVQSLARFSPPRHAIEQQKFQEEREYVAEFSGYVLDFVTPYAEYTFPALDELYYAGARFFVMFHFETTACPVVPILEHVQNRGYTTVINVSIAVATEFTSMVEWVASISGDRAIDVVLICEGWEMWDVFFTTSRSLNVVPKSIVAHTPGVLQAMYFRQEQSALSDMIEPRPWQFLSDPFAVKYTRWSPGTGLFYDVYAKPFISDLGEPPSMMALQMSAVQAVIGNALAIYVAQFANIIANPSAVISEYATNFNTSTFDGVKRFNLTNGKCISCKAGIHQVIDLPEYSGSYDIATSFERYQEGIIRIVSPSGTIAGESLGGGLENNTLPLPPLPPEHTHLQYPMASWRAKEKAIYPCVEGCYIAGPYCYPCATGRDRSKGDLFCRPCANGTFAAYGGEAFCKECPDGASCNKTDQLPTALPGWYRLKVAPVPDRHCSEYFQDANPHDFVKCTNAGRCLGNNECPPDNLGALCANCRAGKSVFGAYPNRGRCADCSSDMVIWVAVVVNYVLYLGAAVLLSSFAHKRTAQLGGVTIPLLMILIRHMQVQGVVHTSLGMDLNDDSFWKEIPGVALVWTVMPLPTMQLDCLLFEKDQVESESQEEHMAALRYICDQAVAMFFNGLAVIVAYHVLIEIVERIRMQSRFSLDFRLDDGVLASRRFVRAQWLMDLEVRHYHFFTQFIAWSLLIVPMILCTCSFVMACGTMVGSTAKNVFVRPDINCDDDVYTKHMTELLPWILLVGLAPVILFGISLLQFFSHEAHIRMTRLREVFGILTIGWKSTYQHFEVLYFFRTNLLAAVPYFARDRQLVFFAMVAIIIIFEIYVRVKHPRLKSGRSILLWMERWSVYILLFTLLCSYTVSADFIRNPLLKTAMFPDFWVKNIHIPLNVGSALNIIFFCFTLIAILWYEVYLPRQMEVLVYHNSNCFDKFVQRFANMFFGMNSVKMDVRTASLDNSEINQSERNFFMNVMRLLVSCWMDSEDHLSVQYFAGILTEVFVRASQTRAAELNAHSGTMKNIRRAQRLARIRRKVRDRGETDTANLGVVKTPTTDSGEVTRDMDPAAIRSVKSSRKSFRTNVGDMSRALKSLAPRRMHTFFSFASKSKRTNMPPEFYDLRRHGITLDEFYIAFIDVEEDVITREPGMRILVREHLADAGEQDEKKKLSKQDKLKEEAKVEPLGEERPFLLTILRARNLRHADLTSAPDPYCLCTVGGLADDRMVATGTVWNSNEPVWNERFVMKLRPGEALHFDVLDNDDNVGEDDSLGTCKLSSSLFYTRPYQESVILVDLNSTGDIQPYLEIRVENVTTATKAGRHAAQVEDQMEHDSTLLEQHYNQLVLAMIRHETRQLARDEKQRKAAVMRSFFSRKKWSGGLFTHKLEQTNKLVRSGNKIEFLRNQLRKVKDLQQRRELAALMLGKSHVAVGQNSVGFDDKVAFFAKPSDDVGASILSPRARQLHMRPELHEQLKDNFWTHISSVTPVDKLVAKNEDDDDDDDEPEEELTDVSGSGEEESKVKLEIGKTFYFDTGADTIHPKVFGASFLKALRMCGISEKAYKSYEVDVQDAGHQTLVRAQGDPYDETDYLDTLLKLDHSKINVMGYPLTKVEPFTRDTGIPWSKEARAAPLGTLTGSAPCKPKKRSRSGKGSPILRMSERTEMEIDEGSARMTAIAKMHNEMDVALASARWLKARSILPTEVPIKPVKKDFYAGKEERREYHEQKHMRRLFEDIARCAGYFQKYVADDEKMPKPIRDVSRDGHNVRFKYVKPDGAGSQFHLIWTADFPGGDPIRAMAAFAEMDIASNFNHTVRSASEIIGKCATGRCDAFWQAQMYVNHLGIAQDNLVHNTIMDCLEENNSLFVCVYTPRHNNSQIKGLDLTDRALELRSGYAIRVIGNGYARKIRTDKSVLGKDEWFGKICQDHRACSCEPGNRDTIRIEPFRKEGTTGNDPDDLWGFKVTLTSRYRVHNDMEFKALWLPPPWAGSKMSGTGWGNHTEEKYSQAPIIQTNFEEDWVDKLPAKLQEHLQSKKLQCKVDGYDPKTIKADLQLLDEDALEARAIELGARFAELRAAALDDNVKNALLELVVPLEEKRLKEEAPRADAYTLIRKHLMEMLPKLPTRPVPGSSPAREGEVALVDLLFGAP